MPTASRRDILKAAVALPFIITRRAWAADVDLRLGFIGVRNMGKSHLNGLARYCAAICDVDANILAAAQTLVREKTEREVHGFGDYRRLFESGLIDAVIIATPDHWHAKLSIEAMRAGLDVYCEKPMTLTVAEGRAMATAARAAGRILQCGSQQRSANEFRTACELVRSGRIGRVHTVRVGIPGVNFEGPAVPDGDPPPELNYDMWLGPAPYRPYNAKQVHYNFRFFWPYSGGQMTNWGAHHLDIAQWGLGMDEAGPLAVEGTAEYHPDGWYEVPRRFDCTYEYPDGVTVLCGSSQPGGTTFEGSDGKIMVNRGKLASEPAEVIETPLGDGDVRLYRSRSQTDNWMDCIRSRELPICDVEIGHRSATVCHLGNLAIRTGRKITWNAESEQIVNDPEANAMLSYDYRAPWTMPA